MLGLLTTTMPAQTVAVRGRTIHTMTGPPIVDGIVLIVDGKIAAVGPADSVPVPSGCEVLEAAVVTPGLIDAHCVVGIAGMLNQEHDQDQIDKSSAVQPQLRAVDAYNPDDPLVAWVRGFGVTTIHTGHAPGPLISGQTMIVKTAGDSLADSIVRPAFAVAATLGSAVSEATTQAPGTRGKSLAVLREKLLAAQHYARQRASKAAAAASAPATEEKSDAKEEPGPARNLELEALADVLEGRLQLLITADKAIDIHAAIRLRNEFQLPLILDSVADAPLTLRELKSEQIPVILHPTQARTIGDRENLSFTTAARLAETGIPFALQGGYESYVPKARVVLFEAGVAAAHELGFERALASITRDAAILLKIDDRVGSLAVGKDGDLALYDGDPFEYTTHCLGTLINGRVVSREVR